MAAVSPGDLVLITSTGTPQALALGRGGESWEEEETSYDFGLFFPFSLNTMDANQKIHAKMTGLSFDTLIPITVEPAGESSPVLVKLFDFENVEKPKLRLPCSGYFCYLYMRCPCKLNCAKRKPDNPITRKM